MINAQQMVVPTHLLMDHISHNISYFAVVAIVEEEEERPNSYFDKTDYFD